MNDAENLMRAYRFRGPERIPATVHVSPACWPVYRGELEDVLLRHPMLFPDFRKGEIDFDNMKFQPESTAGKPWRDPWGCVWETLQDGIVGIISEHPLANWDAFDGYGPPDPDVCNGRHPRNWPEIAQEFERERQTGGLARGALPHGHTFLMLTYIRGYENLIFDMCEEHPSLPKLIDMVEAFNLAVVQCYLDRGAQAIGYGEDLGAQTGPMLSPDQFRKYIKPVYQRLMAPAREQGCLVCMHSDGHLWTLMDDLLECGIDVINLQDRIHGIDEIAKRLKGRLCIDLDIDRQTVTRFGSPKDIDELIREPVMKLNAPEGGLCLMYALGPGVPLENVEALMTAMEKYSVEAP